MCICPASTLCNPSLTDHSPLTALVRRRTSIEVPEPTVLCAVKVPPWEVVIDPPPSPSTAMRLGSLLKEQESHHRAGIRKHKKNPGRWLTSHFGSRQPETARSHCPRLHIQTVRPRQIFAFAGDKQYEPVPYLAFNLDPISLNFTAD